MPMMPISEWLPDLPAFANPGAEMMTNAVPHDTMSYQPLRSFAAVSNTISTQARGAIFGRDASGNVTGFAGTATRLYDYTAATAPNWKDVTRAAGNYSTSQTDFWSWVFYGTRLIAAQSNDDIQQFVMGSSTLFTALAAGTAPKAKYVARVRDNFIMVANTVDTVSGAVPWRVWWPAVGDPTNWPTPGTSTAAQLQSDFRDLIGNGGENQGIVGGLANADVAVFQRFAVWRGMYVGPPVIFSFAAVENARGCIVPGSIVQVGPVCYYLADDGFYMFDGIQSTPIGRNKVDRTFWQDVDRSNLFRVQGSVDPTCKLIYWAYPGPGNSGGNPNKYMVYNYALQRWALRNDGGAIEILIQRSLTLGYTMEQLDAFGTMDTLPEPLDSIVWQGGSLNFGAFDTTHKLGYFNGATLPATIETTEVQLNDAGTAYVSRVQPIIDTPNVQVQLGTRMRQADPVVYSTAQGITSRTGWAPVRASGAYHRARLTTQAGDAWLQAQGVLVDFRPAGRG